MYFLSKNRAFEVKSNRNLVDIEAKKMLKVKDEKLFKLEFSTDPHQHHNNLIIFNVIYKRFLKLKNNGRRI